MLTASRADPCDSPATVPAHSQEVMRIQRGHVLPAVRVMHIQAALLPGEPTEVRLRRRSAPHRGGAPRPNAPVSRGRGQVETVT